MKKRFSNSRLSQKTLIIAVVALIVVFGFFFTYDKLVSPTRIALVNFQPYMATSIQLANTDKFIKYENMSLDELRGPALREPRSRPALPRESAAAPPENGQMECGQSRQLQFEPSFTSLREYSCQDRPIPAQKCKADWIIMLGPPGNLAYRATLSRNICTSSL